MKKRLLVLLLTAALILTLLPATALAADVIEVGVGGTYALTEDGLNDAIDSANDGDTIKFVSGGTIALADTIDINEPAFNESITLDLNGQTIGFNFSGDFDFLSIRIGYSLTVKGPGTITTNQYIESSGTLTVQGGAVIEGTGSWATLRNNDDGTVSMTGGTLRNTNGKAALINDGAATFDNVTIETSSAIEPVILTHGALSLTDCTTINNFSGTMTTTDPSVILAANSGAALTLNGGSVTAPAGSTVPAIYANSTATFTNNGATITGSYVKKLGDLSVSVSSGAGKVTLAPQTAEPGVTYYYKTAAADDTAGKPSYDTAFNSAGWTAFSTATDIATASTATVYVQVVKVGDIEQKIYGWGQGSATPTAAPIAHTASIYVNGRKMLTASVSGGTWGYDSAYLALTDNGNGTSTIKGLKAGTTTVTYTAGNVAETFTVTIIASKLPATGQDFTWVWVFGIAAAAVLGYAYLMLRKKRNHA